MKSMKAYVPRTGMRRMYAQPSGRPRVMRKQSLCKYSRTKTVAALHALEADRITPTVTVQDLLSMRDKQLNSMLRTMKLMTNQQKRSRRRAVCASGRRVDAKEAVDKKRVTGRHHSASLVQCHLLTHVTRHVEIGRRLLEGKHIILHTDSAKAYAVASKTMHHTHVVHMKKKVDGKWLDPRYVESLSRDGPSGD
eukprot:5362911-Amphidinium_carterae.4